MYKMSHFKLSCFKMGPRRVLQCQLFVLPHCPVTGSGTAGDMDQWTRQAMAAMAAMAVVGEEQERQGRGSHSRADGR